MQVETRCRHMNTVNKGNHIQNIKIIIYILLVQLLQPNTKKNLLIIFYYKKSSNNLVIYIYKNVPPPLHMNPVVWFLGHLPPYEAASMVQKVGAGSSEETLKMNLIFLNLF